LTIRKRFPLQRFELGTSSPGPVAGPGWPSLEVALPFRVL
jgi:hypothetical protein